MGGEPWVSVRDHLPRESEPLIDVIQVEVSDSLSGDRGGTGDEDGCSRASVVDDCEYCIIHSVLWELGDEIHRYFFEWVRSWSWCDAVDGCPCVVRQVLVLLAGSASFDVVFYPLVHAGPPVLSLRRLGGFVSPWMSSGGIIVVASHDLPSQLYLRGNYYPTVFEPLGSVVMRGVEVEVMCVFPLFHCSSVGLLSVGHFSS